VGPAYPFHFGNAYETRRSPSLNMPRPKVIHRKRVSRACTTCKRRKERCDGLQPCNRCKYRAKESECAFPEAARSASSVHVSPLRDQSRDASSELVGSRVSPEPDQDTSSYNSHHDDATATVSASAASAPVQELSRFLQDPKGKTS
jgi:hypothetical protein